MADWVLYALLGAGGWLAGAVVTKLLVRWWWDDAERAENAASAALLFWPLLLPAFLVSEGVEALWRLWDSW
jgi:hypothetical protein